MSRRKNLFLIGRRRGDENQLTEMLAYLLQEEPALVPAWLASLGLPAGEPEAWRIETQVAVEAGFCDLVLRAPGLAAVVWESKLGSTTSYGQIAKYARHLMDVAAEPAKALVFTTQHLEELPAGVEAEAAPVTLIVHRWHELGAFLRGSGTRLAADFVEMLEKEGIVAPEPFTPLDWEAWRRGIAVNRRLRELLEELVIPMRNVVPDLAKAGATSALASGLLHRRFEFGSFVVWLAFWPSRRPTHPEHHATVNTYVAEISRPRAERKKAAQAAAAKTADPAVAFVADWEEYAVRYTRPAQEVVTAPDYAGQRDDLVACVDRFLDTLREVGYLLGHAEASVPSTSAPGVTSLSDSDAHGAAHED